jgi:phospholipid-binding lipoprotein MlaA
VPLPGQAEPSPLCPLISGCGVCAFLFLIVMAAGCATTGNPDPLQPLNRRVHAFNEVVDSNVFRPVARGYVAVLPEPVRVGVHNVFANLRTPTTIINQLLQGKPAEGGRATGRFLVNSTVGILGFFDVAARWGLEADREDFGQTLAVWGLPRGPFLMLPFLGPSSVRDGAGTLAGIYTYPPTYAEEKLIWWLYGVDFLQLRAEFLKAERMLSGDRYLFVRDAYLQRRDSLIRDGKTPATDPFLDE